MIEEEKSARLECNYAEINTNDELLLSFISREISESSTIDDLENIIVHRYETDWSLNSSLIIEKISSFYQKHEEQCDYENSNKEDPYYEHRPEYLSKLYDYLKTLRNLNDGIFYFIDIGNCLSNDDIAIYFINNFENIGTHKLELIKYILDKSSDNVIEYLLQQKHIYNYESICHEFVGDIYSRPSAQLVKNIINMGVDLSFKKSRKTGRNDKRITTTIFEEICIYFPFEIVKYAFKKMPLDKIDYTRLLVFFHHNTDPKINSIKTKEDLESLML